MPEGTTGTEPNPPVAGPEQASEPTGKWASQVFENLDGRLAAMELSVAKRFGHGTWGAALLELFEPALSGFAMGLALLALDSVRGQKENPLSAHFIASATSHLEPLLFPLALFAFCITFFLAGSQIARQTRRVLAVPMLRLFHHGLMVAIGAMWVAALREMVTGQMTASDLWKVTLVTYLGGAVAAIAYGGIWLAKSELIRSWEDKFRSFRWLLTLVGAILATCALSDVGHVLDRTAREHRADQCQCEGQDPAVSTSQPSQAASMPEGAGASEAMSSASSAAER